VGGRKKGEGGPDRERQQTNKNSKKVEHKGIKEKVGEVTSGWELAAETMSTMVDTVMKGQQTD